MAEARQTMNPEVSGAYNTEILKLMAARGISPERVLDGILGNPDYLIEDANRRPVPVDLPYLRNKKNWVSNDLSLHVFKNIAGIIGGDRPLFLVGRSVFSSKVAGLTGFLIRVLSVRPIWLLKKTAEISARLSRVKRITFHDFDKNSGMRVRIRYIDQDMNSSVFSCQFSEGGLVGFVSIFAKNVRSEKISCICEGDEYCEYVMSWEKRSLLEKFFRSVSPAFQLMQDDLESAGYVPDEDARML